MPKSRQQEPAAVAADYQIKEDDLYDNGDDDDDDLNLEIVSLRLDFDNGEDNNDEGEFQGLLGSGPDVAKSERQDNSGYRSRNMAVSGALVVWNRPMGVWIVRSIAIFLVLGCLVIWGKKLISLQGHASSCTTVPCNTTTLSPVSYYECPAQIDKAINDKDHIFDFYNTDTENHAKIHNMTVNELLNMEYGAWGITPYERKAMNAHWIHWYADSLTAMAANKTTTSPLTIYESACGVGLTLYVILELLAERYNMTGLEVYGNEYMEVDVVFANRFYQERQHDNSTFPLKLGRICHGDSTHLFFVPSDTFDLVMTGYIDPIVDPLNLKLSNQKYREYCRSHNPRKQQLMAQEQALVEDFFANWTGEMIRIAKPGAAIIVESIAYPKCQVGDWGGVDKKWWSLAVTKYGWDVDPVIGIETMEFDPDAHHETLDHRYNVKMIKQVKPS